MTPNLLKSTEVVSIILAFDTATDRLTVAVGTDKRVLAEINVVAPREHMERLLPAVDKVLNESKIPMEQIDAVAVGVGPGSFTGVRIGVTTARGFAQGWNKKLIGISTSDCVAYGLDWEGKIACLVDAKRDEIYVTFYQSFGRRIERISDHEIMTPEAFCVLASDLEKDNLVLTGDALGPYGQFLRDKLHLKARFALEDSWYPRASDLIKLSTERFVLESGSLLDVEPIYVRLSQAEESWRQKEADAIADIVLEVMSTRDLKEVLRIEKSLFLSPWSQWMFKAEIESERSYCLIAKAKDKVIGYAALNFLEQDGHLLNLAVIPEYQNLGIGSVLAVQLIKWAANHGIHRLTLEVRPSNVFARKLYQKFGFQEIGVRKKYYAETNEDGLILWTGDITFPIFQQRLSKIRKRLERQINIIDNT